MNKQQAHELKLKMAVFAEKTAMLEYYEQRGIQSALDLALSERDKSRNDLYSFIDQLTETEE
jgi:hypothetical protein